MPEAWTETLQQFSWEGRLSLTQLGLLGGVVALILVFFAWRESKLITRPKAAWVLLTLRLLTLLIVLWALAEPTDVLTEKKFRPKTLGIFLDTSASMTLQDPGDGSGDFQRWQEALQGGEASLRKKLDKVHGGLVAGSFNLKSKDKDTAEAAVTDALEQMDGLTLPDGFDAIRTMLKDVIIPKIASLSNKEIRSLKDQEAKQSVKSQLDDVVQRWRALLDQQYEEAEKPNVGSGKDSRLAKAPDWLTTAEDAWIKDLSEDVQVERCRFDSEAIAMGRRDWLDTVSMEVSPDKGTDETAWMKQLNRFDAALVVSDGVHNTGDSPRDLAPSLSGVSTVIVPIGDTRLRRDVFLHHVKYPQSVIEKDTLVVEGIVTAHDCRQEKIVVQLLADDDQVLDQQVFEVAELVADHRISLRWKATELGLHDFRLKVKPVEREFSDDNNEESVKVNVIDDEIRVLLAERLPRWEFRYLKSILQRDKKIQMDSILFNPDHAYRNRPQKAQEESLPQSLEEWSRYRVALLGDLTESELTPADQARLRRWVIEAGGNLIVIAGESMPGDFFDTPLAELFPVRQQRAAVAKAGYQLTVTAEGASTPPVLVAGEEIPSLSVWEKVSAKLPVYDLSPYSIPKATAHVLIQADAGRQSRQALSYLSWQYVGKGRVVYLSAPVAYQLRYRKGDEYHHRFWGQLFRWAIARDLGGGSRTVKLSTDKTRYPYRSDVSVRLRLSEVNGLPVGKAESELLVRSNEELIQTVPFLPDRGALGVYRANLTDLPPGKIRLEACGASIERLLKEEKYEGPIFLDLSVDPHDSAELRVPLADVALLRTIADASGGVVVGPAGVEDTLTKLNLEAIHSENVSRQPLWNRWLLIWLILILLLAEWIGRKAFGLV